VGILAEVIEFGIQQSKRDPSRSAQDDEGERTLTPTFSLRERGKKDQTPSCDGVTRE
jgi:hypothetical protein